MRDKLLVFIHDHIPTTEIIIRSLKSLHERYEVKVATLATFKLSDLLSGQYKLLLMRKCDPSLYHIMYLLQEFKIPYLYYLDDNFWELKVEETPVARYYQDPRTLTMLNKFVTHAALVITGSNQLATYVKQYNANVISIDAAFDFSIIENEKKQPKSDIIKIVYSAGLYRDQDFKVVVQSLKMIAEEFKEKVELHFYGYVPNELKGVRNVVFDENYCPYESFIKKLYSGNFDIGIAPLNNTLSNQAKSNLKYREYGACNIAGIYTNISPYKDCVVDKKNGILVSHTTEGWYHALKLLIENKVLRESITVTALQDVQVNYTDKKTGLDWLRILDQVDYAKKVDVHSVKIFWYEMSRRILDLLKKTKRVKIYYQYHGLKFTLKKIVKHFIPSSS